MGRETITAHTLYTCDRCGKKSKEIMGSVAFSEPYDSSESLDLCVDCGKDFKRFMRCETILDRREEEMANR